MKDTTPTKADKQAAWREQDRKELLANRDLPIDEKFRMVEEMGEFVAQMRKAKTIPVKKEGMTLVEVLEVLVVLVGLVILSALTSPWFPTPAHEPTQQLRLSLPEKTISEASEKGVPLFTETVQSL